MRRYKMKQFKTFLAEAMKSTMRFGGQTFKLERDKGKDGEWVSYNLQGKYKGALYIQVEEEEKMVVLNMDIGSDILEKWIDDVKKKVGEKKWPEDSEGEEQEKYFDNIIIKKIWDDAEKQFKKLGYKVEYGD